LVVCGGSRLWVCGAVGGLVVAGGVEGELAE